MYIYMCILYAIHISVFSSSINHAMSSLTTLASSSKSGCLGTKNGSQVAVGSSPTSPAASRRDEATATVEKNVVAKRADRNVWTKWGSDDHLLGN